MTTPKYLVVARVARPHGVRGDLRVQALTGFPDRMKLLDTVFFARNPEQDADLIEAQVTRARPDKADYWLIHLDGVEDREAADSYRDRYVLVSLADAVPLEKDEIYLFQVMGLEVRTDAGLSLGRVVDIIETGANEVYVVRGETYGEVLIPHTPEVIVSIRPADGLMVIHPIPGLLPE